jgi:hypothetical protein
VLPAAAASQEAWAPPGMCVTWEAAAISQPVESGLSDDRRQFGMHTSIVHD